MEAIRTSETSVYFNKTIRRYIAECCHLKKRLRFKQAHTGLDFVTTFIITNYLRNSLRMIVQVTEKSIKSHFTTKLGKPTQPLRQEKDLFRNNVSKGGGGFNC
jgi:hypothetical protein